MDLLGGLPIAIFTEAQLVTFARSQISSLAKSADVILNESVKSQLAVQAFDAFLSHSIKDSEIILGIKIVLENQGLSVYVDWIEDPHLDRNNVTSETAERLRKRLKQSKSLIYAHSNNSPESKWMPWELGYFDGYKGAVVVFPVVKVADDKFKGQEFLGIYPYIDTISGASLFVNRGQAPQSSLGRVEAGASYLNLKDWMRVRAGV